MISDAAGVARLADRLAFDIAMPDCNPFVAPLLYAISVQLLAYHTAVLKGTSPATWQKALPLNRRPRTDGAGLGNSSEPLIDYATCFNAPLRSLDTDR